MDIIRSMALMWSVLSLAVYFITSLDVEGKYKISFGIAIIMSAIQIIALLGL